MTNHQSKGDKRQMGEPEEAGNASFPQRRIVKRSRDGRQASDPDKHIINVADPCKGSTANENDEWQRRASEVGMLLLGGDEEREHFSQLQLLGRQFRAQRMRKRLTLEQLSQKLEGCTGQYLCFLESGWGTVEEYWSIIDQWSQLLDLDAETQRKKLPLKA